MSEQWLAWKTVGDKVDKPTIKLRGKWKNRLGSTMDLEVRSNRIRGTYKTAVGAPEDSEGFPVLGVVNGDLLSFIVDWKEHGSVTAWVGQHTTDKDGKERIETMWHLALNVAEPEEGQSLWGSVLTGQNTFTKVASRGS